MKIESVNQCHVCKGNNLISIPNSPIEDFNTGDVEYYYAILCYDCETVHYCKDGLIQYEFSVKFTNHYTMLFKKESIE
jgi:hypothetical protein